MNTVLRVIDDTMSSSEITVISRKARSTKTMVELIDCGIDHPDGRWMTVCIDHGGCVHHDNRINAQGWLSHPEEWCPVCQES